MAMRQDCRNYESRTYRSGDTVRSCRLDLAPEAPWRCPENCPKFERKIAGAGFVVGDLVAPPTPDLPPGFDHNSVRLLDEAEDIVNAIGPSIIDEVKSQRAVERRQAVERARRRRRWWWPF